MAECALSGALAFSTRERAGGPFVSGELNWWNTERAVWRRRFERCGIYRDRPFTPFAKDFLFVDFQGLKRLLNEVDGSHKSVDSQQHTVAEEGRAIRKLAALLKSNKQLGRNEAKDAISEYAVSNNRFKNEIWPRAREEAGLDRKARAGRKAKSAA